ncbi:MAG TPA: plastocyanin/azurin family copper-binding protein [Opitutaceae bacterium]|nr:plastocyanin/azurin family copper-binding protein [Opitutaceae bacterium]
MRPAFTAACAAAGALLLAASAGCGRATGAPLGERLLAVEVGEGFAFAPNELRCRAGQPVRLRLSSRLRGASDLAHNVAVLAAGTDADAYGRASIEARAEDQYVPPGFAARTLAVSAFARGGEVVELAFVAPDRPGRYPIVCTFPGHCLLGMKATLTVE